jgi:hypothetical protein
MIQKLSSRGSAQWVELQALKDKIKFLFVHFGNSALQTNYFFYLWNLAKLDLKLGHFESLRLLFCHVVSQSFNNIS